MLEWLVKTFRSLWVEEDKTLKKITEDINEEWDEIPSSNDFDEQYWRG